MGLHSVFFKRKDQRGDKSIFVKIFGSEKTVRLLPIMVLLLLLGSSFVISLENSTFKGLMSTIMFAGLIGFVSFCIFKILKYLFGKSEK
ncbi:hypothetical protein [Acetivibrio saccincola]|jgi:hypothetical protein|uniref:Uncharacterized protein n=1 Tax=Acetivibrio saccincola TaxID=1677857 RepID=A0A2S8R8J6_9FIRM|nr:hypothetical protein [Acetivibrio saccincola]PQQ66119.1 hypothetical protein B9R14_04645 [Acetivibrio saccincola]